MIISSAPYKVMFSTNADRSDAQELNLKNVIGDIYVFTSPDTDVDRMEFFFNDITGSGTPHRSEGNAPYDFNGGQANAANPFDTTDEPDGAHSIAARLFLDDGSEFLATASFFITNVEPVLVPTPSSLDLAADMDGATVSDTVDVSTTGISPADFTVDVPAAATWLTVTPDSGTTEDTLTFEADPTGLAPGDYSTTVTLDSPDALSATVDVDFEVIDNSPPLSFSENSLDFSGDENGAPPADQTVTLTALSGVASATITVPASASWLSVTPTSGNTPLTLDVSVDQVGLASGSYQATITASAPGYADDTLTVNLTVAGDYEIAMSVNSDRSGAVNLAGQVVSGDIYVFTRPDDGDIDYVEFWIDEPLMSARDLHRRENGAPYDLFGGNGDGTARPFDTEPLDDGSHDLTARITFEDGSQVVLQAPFNIANNAPGFEFDPGGYTFNLEEAETDTITVDVDTTDLSETDFALDDVTESWITVTELDSTTPGQIQIDVDTDGLSTGLHTTTLRVTADGYRDETMLIRVLVGDAGLAYFAGDDAIDTEVSIDGDNWLINGELPYEGVTHEGNDIEGLMMNVRMANAIYDDLDGDLHSSMTPWDPRENTVDFIDNLEAYRDHGMLSFNVCLHGGRNRNIPNEHPVDNNPYGADGRQCFDDWDNGEDTPHSQYLVRLGSIIRAADDLGMVVEVGLFHGRMTPRLDDNAAVHAAADGLVDWILAEGWTNVIIEAMNEAGGNNRKQSVLNKNEIHNLVNRIRDRSDGAAGAHLPAGHLLVSVSDLGSRVPIDDWIENSDYVIYHGNTADGPETERDLDAILDRQVYQDDVKPIYTNEHNTDFANVLGPHLDRHVSWGYHNNQEYQRVWDNDDADRWNIGVAEAWWDELAEVTDSNP